MITHMEEKINLHLTKTELRRIITGLKLLREGKSEWLNDKSEKRLYIIKSLELSINEINSLINNLNKEL